MLVRKATVTGWRRGATRTATAAIRRSRRVGLSWPSGARCLLTLTSRKLVTTALPAAIVAVLFNVFVAQAMTVDGPSMVPNLTYDQRVVVEKVIYRFGGSPSRGDVVVVDMPAERELLVKRVVAVAGETVAVQGGQVYVDGEPLAESWAALQGGMNYASTRVPPDHLFVLGDNRVESRDSRFFGPVPMGHIAGRVRFSIWPLERFGQIR